MTIAVLLYTKQTRKYCIGPRFLFFFNMKRGTGILTPMCIEIIFFNIKLITTHRINTNLR